jgi:hypothetical protein
LDGELFFDGDDYVLYSIDDDFYKRRRKNFNYLVPFSRIVRDGHIYNIEEDYALNFENLDDDEIYYYLLDKEINNFIEEFLDDEDLHTKEILTPIYDIGMTAILTKDFYKGFILPTLKKNRATSRVLRQNRFFSMYIKRDRVFHKIYYRRKYLMYAFEPEIFTLYFAVFSIINFTQSYIIQESMRYGFYNLNDLSYLLKSVRDKTHLDVVKIFFYIMKKK